MKIFTSKLPVLSTCCIVIAFSLDLGLSVANAQDAFVRGKGQGENKAVALQKAKENAWNNYLGTYPPSLELKVKNIMANQALFLSNLDQIISDVNVLDEKCDWMKPCSASIKATVNEVVVNTVLGQAPKAQTASGNASGAGPSGPMAFLVMARVASSQTAFLDKVTKRAESTVGTSGNTSSADNSSSRGQASTEAASDTVSVTQTSTTKSGGSTERKTDQIVYAPYPEVRDLQSAIGLYLQNNKIRTVPWASLVNRCKVSSSDKFSVLFAESRDGKLSEEIMEPVYENLKTCGIKRLIFASITVDGFRTDPNTGAPMVSGNLNVEVNDLTSDFAESLGTARGKFAGRAATQADASRNALDEAARQAADLLISQLKDQ